jgi:hypothetical protein
MSMKIIDGFQIFDGPSRGDIYIEENRLDQYIDYIINKNLKNITIDFYWGY